MQRMAETVDNWSTAEDKIEMYRRWEAWFNDLAGSRHCHSSSLCCLTQGQVFLVCVVCVVFLSRSRRLVSFLSFCVFCCCFHVWAAMVSKHKEEVLGSQTDHGRKRSWQMPLRLMAVRNGYASSVPKAMCGPVGASDDVTLTSQQVCRGSTNRLSLRRTKDGFQECIEIKKRRSRSCVHKKRCTGSNKEWRKGRRRRESRREEEVGLEEDCKMEVDEEIDCKKKLDEQRKSLQQQLRDTEKFTGQPERKVEGSVTRD